MLDTMPPKTFPASDEVPHPIGDHPLWQESVFLTWGDVEQGIFGYHRIGQEANANDGKGLVTAWNGIATREGTRYGRYLLQPMRPEDRDASSFGATDLVRMSYDGTTTWTLNDADCAMSLNSVDFTPRYDLFRDGGSVVENFAQGHIEVGGTIAGSLRLGDRRFTIDGFAYRDHSWGKRDRGTMLSHRWIAGTFGPELTFNAASWHSTDGELRTFGIVCRNGRISYATDVDIVVYMEIDALSHRGGMIRLTLDDGDVIELYPKLVDAFMIQHHNTGTLDGMCEVEWNGRRGFCDLEISTNPRAGTAPVLPPIRATMEQGLSRREWTL